MQLITKNGLLRDLPKEYRRHYKYEIGNPRSQSRAKDIISALENEPNLTEDRVIEIMGNRSWIRNECDECGKDCEAVVRLGQEPDYESSTAQICLNCLKEAQQLIESDWSNA